MRPRTALIAMLALAGLPVHGQSTFLLNDTLFIQRDTLPDAYHAIYIVPVGRERVPTPCAALAGQDHGVLVADLREGPPQVVVPKDLRTCWLPLYNWQGKPYRYDPCDGLFEFAITVEGDVLVEHYGDGPLASILSLTKGDHRTPAWERRISQSGEPGMVTAELLDQRTGLTRWTIDGRVRLMVPAARAHLFPLIVNQCGTRKRVEFRFDPVEP